MSDAPRVSVTRKVAVTGVGSTPLVADVLGISRWQFQGLIASELQSVGYLLATPDEQLAARDPATAPLSLVGTLTEEECAPTEPRQCRIAVRWELQDQHGMVVYRVITRAVAEGDNVGVLRRELVEGVLQSLLRRRRFPLQLVEAERPPAPSATDAVLGFRACARPAAALPGASRAVAAGLVFVEAGSSLSNGTIISPDGLVLTSAAGIEPAVPLHVRLAAQQKLPAQVVAIDHPAGVALLRVEGNFQATCVPVREAPLPVGSPVFGVSSPLTEERAISLAGSVSMNERSHAGTESGHMLETDPLIAHNAGAPLLDADGALAGVVTERAPGSSKRGDALPSLAALASLKVKPAAISDARLVGEREHEPELGLATGAARFVRDHDDAPYPLTRRYSYGTSDVAHGVRKAGIASVAVGAAAVLTSWMFAGGAESESAHNRWIAVNDVGWVLAGLGAVGFAGSYAIPEGHDVVAVHTEAR
jgi:S1-C subfamily serine protease